MVDKMKWNRIKTVFFDIGGVLLNIHPERTLRYWRACTQATEEWLQTNFFDEAHHRYERGELTDHEFYLEIKKLLPGKRSLNEREFWHGWGLLLGSENGSSQLLHQLTTQVQVWLLSNTNSNHILQEAERRYTFFQAVQGKVYSYEVGYRKPQPEIFQIALQRAQTTPQASLFIDDMPANVEQARSLGFNTILFTDAEDLKAQLLQLGFELA